MRHAFLVLASATCVAAGCNAILDNRHAKLDPAAVSPASEDHGGVAADAAATGSDLPEPEPECPAGTHACDGTCTSASDPAYGCGDPRCRPCDSTHATAGCEGSECVVRSCERGYADCNRDPHDGCEVDLSKPASCGACGRACPEDTPLCAPSSGGFACTNGCPDTAPLRCDGDCVSPLTSVNHCGSCDDKCPDVANATIACADGGCTFTCKAGYHACGATCAVDTDPKRCGPGCSACPAPANATATCQSNVCGIQCAAGYANCNADAKDGCEAKLATDPLNCGACGKSCNGGACQGGTCQAAAPP